MKCFTECLKNKQGFFAGAYFSLMYDETVNKSGAKELQLRIRYWSSHEEKVVTRHLDTTYMYHATAEDLYKNINCVIDKLNLSRQKFVMLGSDGPNVNKKVWRLINEDIKLANINKKCNINKGLANIGVCSIHTIHNAFLKGLEKLGHNCSDLIIAVKNFFKDRPSRWEDYQKIQIKMKVPQHCFIKHVSSRWLTLSDAAQRLLEQWKAVEHYFLKYIPKSCPNLEKTNTYKTIYNFLKSSRMKAEIIFVISSANLFTKFTGVFQKSEPLIHLVYSEIMLLLKSIMLRFCKPKAIEILEKGNSCVEEIFTFQNLLGLKEIHVGGASKELSENDLLLFLNDAKLHYLACCKYILEKSAVEQQPILSHFRCLHPKNICSRESIRDVEKICKAMPVNIDYEDVVDEWRLLSSEKLPDYDGGRIDAYWARILHLERESGEKRFPNLAVVVKSALSLSHGNADVERGFSCSGKILTYDRASMSSRMLNYLLHIQDAIRYYENKIHLIPIPKELIISAQSAGKKYELHRAELKRKKELEELEEKRKDEERILAENKLKKMRKTKDELENLEKTLKEKVEAEHLKKNVYEELLTAANNKLKKAVADNNLVNAAVAQVMIEKANKMREEETSKMKDLEKQKERLEKRKSTLIEEFIKKKIKTN